MRRRNKLRLRKFGPLKQPDSNTCFYACLAMIVGESVSYVKNWFKSARPLYPEDGVIFLAHHGIYLTHYSGFDDKSEDWMTLKENSTIEYYIPIAERPALLTVRSERFPGKLHVVLWDGQRVWDPNPQVLGPRRIDSYKIVQFWPLMLTEQRWKAMQAHWRKEI